MSLSLRSLRRERRRKWDPNQQQKKILTSTYKIHGLTVTKNCFLSNFIMNESDKKGPRKGETKNLYRKSAFLYLLLYCS